MRRSLLLALLLSACEYPRDPEGTLERVSGGVMRVGLLEHPPWVEKTDSEPLGIELELLRELAADLDSEISIVWGSEEELFTALQHFELDAVAGGLTQRSLWRDRVALTTPFFATRVVIAARSASSVVGIEGRDVAVPAEEPATAALVRAEGGIPVPFPSTTPRLAAIPEWRARSLGLQPTGMVLREEQHVLAAPPGENAWIVRLERFLRARRRAIRERVVREAGEGDP